MRTIRWAFFGAAVLLCVMLSGCGYRELHQRILIQGIGVDRTATGYEVTVRAASSQEVRGDELYTCEGASVLEALSSLSLSTGREPFYSHNYLVVFGRSCGEEGLDQSMDFFIRYYNTRPAVQMYLASNTAKEILSAETGNQFVPMDELQNLGQSGEYNGKAVAVDFLDFVNGARRPGSSPVLPVISVEDNGVQIVGTAYFQQYKLAGFLDLEQTRGYLAAKGKLKSGELVVSGEDFGTVTLTIAKGSGNREVTFRGDIPVFRTVYQVTADVSAISGEQGELDEDFYSQVEKEVSWLLQEEIQSTLNQGLLEDECDIFGFGNLLYQRDSRAWKSLENSWKTAMTQCQYEIQVDATVLRMEQGGLGSE